MPPTQTLSFSSARASAIVMLIISTLAILASVAEASSIIRRGVGDPGTPPPIPATWPSGDQTQFITGALLEDPLVKNALDIVNRVVPANLLQIPPSTYVSGSTVKYNANAADTCYWPNGACVRATNGTGYVADVYTCPGTNDWGISYDDGPTVNLVNGVHTDDTGAIRNALSQLNAKATFFVTGSNSILHPEELIASDAAGHQIAVHTWSHHPLTSLTNAQIVAEIKYTEAIIYRTLGKVPTYMRPPYGDVDDRVRAIVNALGYRVAIWDQDSQDANGVTATAALNNIKAWFSLPKGFVSLEHDISTQTSGVAVNALKEIQGLGANFKFKIQAVATCNGHPFYSYTNTTVPVTTLIAATTNATTTYVATTTTTTTTTTIQAPTITVGVNVNPGVKNGSARSLARSKGSLIIFVALIASIFLVV